MNPFVSAKVLLILCLALAALSLSGLDKAERAIKKANNIMLRDAKIVHVIFRFVSSDDVPVLTWGLAG